MTRLEANVHDFHVREDTEGEILAWRFRFGYCEDFNDALNQFKRGIALEDRTPSPASGWLWEVKATAKNRRIMESIFDNFEQCLNVVKSQMRMFGN